MLSRSERQVHRCVTGTHATDLLLKWQEIKSTYGNKFSVTNQALGRTHKLFKRKKIKSVLLLYRRTYLLMLFTKITTQITWLSSESHLTGRFFLEVCLYSPQTNEKVGNYILIFVPLMENQTNSCQSSLMISKESF